MKLSTRLVPLAFLLAPQTAGAQPPRQILFVAQNGETFQIDPIAVFQDGEWLDPLGDRGEDVPMQWRA